MSTPFNINDKIISSIIKNDINKLEIALKKGADIEYIKPNFPLRTAALAYALWCGHVALAKFIKENGANTENARSQLDQIVKDDISGSYKEKAVKALAAGAKLGWWNPATVASRPSIKAKPAPTHRLLT